MRLVLTHSDRYFAPKRPRPIHSDASHPTRRVVSLLRAYPNGQDPPLRSGEKPHGLRYACPRFCLTPSLNLLRQPEPYCPRHRARTPHLTKQPTYVSINSCIKEHLSNESHKRTRSRRSPSSSITKFSLTYSLLSGRNSQQVGK